jgi:hypothetical protein
MTQIPRAPFGCHLDKFSVCGVDGATNGDLCAFEFPWCDGCPKACNPKEERNGDPVKVAIWYSWIKGVVAPDLR